MLTSQTTDEPRTERLVPPRPNLGPEPWPENSFGMMRTGWIGFSLFLALLLVGIWIYRRFSRSMLGESPEMIDPQRTTKLTPRDRLIARSEQVREAFSHAFGPSWRSKTTEEIQADRGLSERLDAAEFVRLVAFLKLADRAKFANSEPEGEEDWESWVEAFADRLREPASRRDA